MNKEKNENKAEISGTPPDKSPAIERKEEKKDNLLSADHKPDTPMEDERLEKVNEKAKETDKIDKDRERSPRKSRSKSRDRSRY